MKEFKRGLMFQMAVLITAYFIGMISSASFVPFEWCENTRSTLAWFVGVVSLINMFINISIFIENENN